ncbi:MAG: hypothetical protein ABSF54_01640 [Bryobacteraceae bacterium]|jgi:hypothetical protein
MSARSRRRLSGAEAWTAPETPRPDIPCAADATGNYECTGQTVFAETVEFNEEHKSDAWPGWLTAAARKLP